MKFYFPFPFSDKIFCDIQHVMKMCIRDRIVHGFIVGAAGVDTGALAHGVNVIAGLGVVDGAKACLLYTSRGKFVLNLLPSGILRPNVVCVMGNGMVIDPHHLDGEINKLREQGISITPDNLKKMCIRDSIRAIRMFIM